MFAVGLTGGIGSGKSHVAALFAHHGVAIVDSDAIAHALTAPGGEAMPAIRAAFGDALITPDGRLDRAAMRARVFDDPAARKQLEAILHPMIRERADAEARAAHGAPYVIFVVPLLVESGHWRGRLDRVLVIDCDEADQIARVVARNGLAPAQVRAIIATQAARDARLAVANDVIDNGEPLRDLHAEVAALHARYLALARDKAARTGPR